MVQKILPHGAKIFSNALGYCKQHCVAGDTVITITHYVGEDLKYDFALIDSVCILVCKKFLCTEGKTKLSGMKI